MKQAAVNSPLSSPLLHLILLSPPRLGVNFVLNVACFTKNHSTTCACTHMCIHKESCMIFMFFDLYENKAPFIICWDLLFLLNSLRSTHVVCEILIHLVFLLYNFPVCDYTTVCLSTFLLMGI